MQDSPPAHESWPDADAGPARRFAAALGFLTRIRVSDAALATNLRQAVGFFPAVGLLIGAIAAAVYWVAQLVLPIPVAVTLSVIATAMITGGFHEDGLADSADGLGGGYSRDAVLRIMQDSRIGTFGALALVLALVLKIQVLSALGNPWIVPALLVGHSISRLASTTVIRINEYVRAEGLSKPLADRITPGSLLLASAFGLAPLLLLPWNVALCVVAAVGIATAYLAHRGRVRIGGYTGDLLGMTQQVTELVAYLVICAWLWPG